MIDAIFHFQSRPTPCSPLPNPRQRNLWSKGEIMETEGRAKKVQNIFRKGAILVFWTLRGHLTPSHLNCKEMNNKRVPLVRSPIPSPLPLKMLGYLCLRKCFRIKSSPTFWFNLDSRLPWLRFFCRSIFLKMPVIHLPWAAYFVPTVSTEKEAFSANQLSAKSLTEKSWLFVSLF